MGPVPRTATTKVVSHAHDPLTVLDPPAYITDRTIIVVPENLPAAGTAVDTVADNRAGGDKLVSSGYAPITGETGVNETDDTRGN